jgi:hypothetical protein
MARLVFATLVPYILALLVHLAGLVVAIILLIRIKGTAAILATVGFALLTVISLGLIVVNIPAVAAQLFQAGVWSLWVSNCCCGLLEVGAIVCLIIALWQALSGTAPKQAGGTPGPLV